MGKNALTMLRESFAGLSRQAEDLIQASIADSEAAALRQRLKIINEIDKFYDGYMEWAIAQRPGETVDEYQRRAKICVPHLRRVADEKAGLLYSGYVARDFADERAKTFFTEIFDRVHYDNLMATVDLTAVKSGLCAVKPVVLDRVIKGAPRRVIDFDCFAGDQVIVSVDPLNKHQIKSVLLYFTVREAGQTRISYAELWTAEEVMTIYGDKKPVIVPNPYQVIPFILFIEEPDDVDPNGNIPLYNTLGMNKQINELWSDLRHLNAMQAHSQAIGRGISDADGIKWGEDKLVKLLNPEAEISYITPDPKSSEIMDSIKQLTKELYETARVPDPVEKKQVELSGTALKMLMVPTMAYRQKKISMWSLYEAALVELVQTVAAAHGLIGWGNADLGYTVAYPKNAFPFQTDEDRAKNKEDFDMGVISQVDIYIEDHPGATRAEAMEALLRAKEERQTLENAGQLSFEDLVRGQVASNAAPAQAAEGAEEFEI